jgi:hypothetical protein
MNLEISASLSHSKTLQEELLATFSLMISKRLAISFLMFLMFIPGLRSKETQQLPCPMYLKPTMLCFAIGES